MVKTQMREPEQNRAACGSETSADEVEEMRLSGIGSLDVGCSL
jgi:hypothetical protein